MMNRANGIRSPISPESSSSSSSLYSHQQPYTHSNINSPVSVQANSPNSQYGYSAASPPHGVHSRGQHHGGPRIIILNQPQKKFRFRYISEMTGTHGCLMGETTERNKKEYIRVMVCTPSNWPTLLVKKCKF